MRGQEDRRRPEGSCEVRPRQILSIRQEGTGKEELVNYENAQINEIADILETIRDVVDMATSSLPERRRTAGRPPVPASNIVKVKLMQAYFGMPNRIAEGFLRLFGEKLGISSTFSYKTIERAMIRKERRISWTGSTGS